MVLTGLSIPQLILWGIRHVLEQAGLGQSVSPTVERLRDWLSDRSIPARWIETKQGKPSPLWF
jgi:hypothetical protein